MLNNEMYIHVRRGRAAMQINTGRADPQTTGRADPQPTRRVCRARHRQVSLRHLAHAARGAPHTVGMQLGGLCRTRCTAICRGGYIWIISISREKLKSHVLVGSAEMLTTMHGHRPLSYHHARMWAQKVAAFGRLRLELIRSHVQEDANRAIPASLTPTTFLGSVSCHARASRAIAGTAAIYRKIAISAGNQIVLVLTTSQVDKTESNLSK